MYDVIIIGKGPAGISAALYTHRGKLKTLIIGKDSSLLKAAEVHNYYGFPGGISGEELLRRGESQAKQLGIEILDDTILSIGFEECTFKVITKDKELCSKTLLIATGQILTKLKIENIEKFEGKGIHYCVICDGFFYTNKKVGILGYTDYAVHEALELLNFSKNLTIYTDGNSLNISAVSSDKLKLNNIQINNKKIIKFEGEDNLEGLVFEDGLKENIEGIFIAYGQASSIDFARKLGILIDKESIVVDKDQKTNIEGLFSAGDCTGGLKQISIAVGQGAIAGQKIVEYIRNLSK